jgi:hypothetical protein
MSVWQRLDPVDDDTPANVLAGALLGLCLVILGLAVLVASLIH